jgi:DNA-binding NarL/FixJ family response regulator
MRVMLVEDDDRFADDIHAGLASAERVQVVARARSMFEALQQSRHHCPDLVISSAAIPGGTGFQIPRQLSSLCPRAAFVLLTDSGGEEVDVDPRAFGVVACIPKASIRTRLAATVARVLAARSALRPT